MRAGREWWCGRTGAAAPATPSAAPLHTPSPAAMAWASRPLRPTRPPARAPPRHTPQPPRSAPPRAAADPRRPAPDAEVSHLAAEDVLLFLLQQDCDVGLNRALAVDEFDAAAAVRDRRDRIDAALAALTAARAAAGDEGAPDGGGAAPPASAGDAVDAALAGVRLRAELAAAVEAEDYGAAASIRDALRAAEAVAAATANALAARAERAGAPPALRLGQRVVHAELGYRGVVCG